MAAPRPISGHYRVGLTHPMLITASVKFLSEGHQDPRNEDGSLNHTKHLMGFT